MARHLSERVVRGQSPCSLNTGPYCKARQRLPLSLVAALTEAVGRAFESGTSDDWKWRSRCVKLMDGTALSMPDTPTNHTRYPLTDRQKASLGFPLKMMLGIVSLSTAAVLNWALGPCRGKHTGEQALFHRDARIECRRPPLNPRVILRRGSTAKAAREPRYASSVTRSWTIGTDSLATPV